MPSVLACRWAGRRPSPNGRKTSSVFHDEDLLAVHQVIDGEAREAGILYLADEVVKLRALSRCQAPIAFGK